MKDLDKHVVFTEPQVTWIKNFSRTASWKRNQFTKIPLLVNY